MALVPLMSICDTPKRPHEKKADPLVFVVNALGCSLAAPSARAGFQPNFG